MMDLINLRGIDVYAHHGVHPAERELGQRFVIDVDLWYDCTDAARTDDLNRALDYSAVHGIIRSTAADQTFHLLEALAGLICTNLLQEFDLQKVSVTVRKPNPPIPGFLGTAAVTLVRDRSWLETTPGSGS